MRQQHMGSDMALQYAYTCSRGSKSPAPQRHWLWSSLKHNLEAHLDL